MTKTDEKSQHMGAGLLYTIQKLGNDMMLTATRRIKGNVYVIEYSGCIQVVYRVYTGYI